MDLQWNIKCFEMLYKVTKFIIFYCKINIYCHTYRSITNCILPFLRKETQEKHVSDCLLILPRSSLASAQKRRAQLTQGPQCLWEKEATPFFSRTEKTRGADMRGGGVGLEYW